MSNKYQVVEGAIGWNKDYREVYKYRNKETGKTVAMKTLSLKSDSDYGVSWMTIRKISLLKEIHHDNVARLMDILYNESRSLVHLLLEYADIDLRSFMKSNPVKAVDRRFIRNILQQILRGVSCYHSINVAHGNLNPFNVLIDCHNLTAKITDLDLLISPSYTAPEILCDSSGTTVQVSPAADMFSIGCIFAEMLTRKPLFDGESKYHEIVSISRLVGGNLDKPGGVKMPNVAPSIKNDSSIEKESIVRNLEKLIPDFRPSGIDLLSKMLHADPRRRITVDEALEHNYFKSGVQIQN